MQLTFGSDPEMFVFDGDTKWLIPAFEFLPMKHEQPFRHPNGNLYADGFAAEWTFDKPYTNMMDFTSHMQLAMQHLWNFARNYNPNAVLTLVNGVKIPQDILDAARPDQVELGCIPSLNAHGLRGLPVENPRLFPYRFAGGHLHFGGLPRSANFKRIVSVLDYAVGSEYGADKTNHPLRRLYYGQAGEYRVPKAPANSKRLEYRTLDNSWLATPFTMMDVWDEAQCAVEFAMKRMADDMQISEGMINRIQRKVAREVWDYNTLYTVQFDATSWDLQ